MKRNILLLGAGKSSGALIRYFSERSAENNWQLTVADLSLQQAEEKIAGMPGTSALRLDMQDEGRRREAIREASLVISMLPAHMHVPVAEDCVEEGVSLATASYVTPGMEALHDEACNRGIILLNECGLDPGLDHMSAMALIDNLKNRGAGITSFKSYTGGLVAPASNDNPWGYKFSWNPRNVILAGQGTAKYIENGFYKYIPYPRLFSEAREVTVTNGKLGTQHFDGYANRDSLAYRQLYGLDDVPTMIRGTLRQKNFCHAWQVFVHLGLTDDSYVVENSDRLTYAQWVMSCMPEHLPGKTATEKLASWLGMDPTSEIFKMITWTGVLSDEPIRMAGVTPAQALQQLLEKKWVLRPADQDMIVMQHEIRYQEQPGGNEYIIRSSLVETGVDSRQTAMARTVGLPLAMAAKLILENKISKRGCLVPVLPEIYGPVLKELEAGGLRFEESHHAVSLTL